MMRKKLYDIQDIVNELEKDTEGLILLCGILEDYLCESNYRKGSLLVRMLGIGLKQMKKKETAVFNAVDNCILEEKKHCCNKNT